MYKSREVNLKKHVRVGGGQLVCVHTHLCVCVCVCVCVYVCVCVPAKRAVQHIWWNTHTLTACVLPHSTRKLLAHN